MHTVDRIEIEGFRGSSKPLILNFDEKVNFIIGRNGTGKTSLINLINAALSGDSVQLKSALFSKISIRLKARGSSKRPWIRYLKVTQGSIEPTLHFSIQQKSLDSISYEEIEDQEPQLNSLYRHTLLGMQNIARRNTRVNKSLQDRISQYVVTTWLSVHRSSDSIESDPERQYESPVDQRLHHVFRKFGTFFSTLDKASAELTDRFQTNYFLSLISPPKVSPFSGEAGNINADAEKEALREMFSEFGVSRSAYSSKLDSFAKQVTRAVNWQQENKGKGIPSDIFLTLTDALRIDSLVKEWADLLNNRGEIYNPKSDFISIINNLLYKKDLTIDAGNQPEFTNDRGDVVSPDYLSSGEKQLLIILGEALIQRGQSYIFMADEPELSLHIDWQEKLVPSLRKINSSSQIIFATHSPDIVGAFGKNTLDLEKALS